MSQQRPNSAQSAINNSINAAEFLEGVELGSGWKVTSKVPKNPAGTGGHFSIPYFVERTEDGVTRRAFLKVLNLRQALNTSDPLREIQRLTTAFNFERDTLALCRNRKLKRVATIIEDGQYNPPNSQFPVFFIIFELADGGDIRRQMNYGQLDLAWTLRTLHHISVGLRQLHSSDIAHQDLKPSNVLVFKALGAKVSDLGCADTRGAPGPRAQLHIAGDCGYAPPELLYNEVSVDWNIRRLGCDLYLLGSMIVFFFTGGSSMTAAIISTLHPDHRPFKWGQDYRSALPYVRAAFEQAIDVIRLSLPAPVQGPIVESIRYLCDPDPMRRGHPHNPAGEQFSLERIVSMLNLLAAKAEHGLIS